MRPKFLRRQHEPNVTDQTSSFPSREQKLANCERRGCARRRLLVCSMAPCMTSIVGILVGLQVLLAETHLAHASMMLQSFLNGCKDAVWLLGRPMSSCSAAVLLKRPAGHQRCQHHCHQSQHQGLHGCGCALAHVRKKVTAVWGSLAVGRSPRALWLLPGRDCQRHSSALFAMLYTVRGQMEIAHAFCDTCSKLMVEDYAVQFVWVPCISADTGRSCWSLEDPLFNASVQACCQCQVNILLIPCPFW